MIAASLHQNGHALLLCGRTPQPQLEIRPDGGDPIIVPGPVHTDPHTVTARVDLVFLTVKATQLDQARNWLAVLCDASTVVCVLQNGVEHTELVQPYCPLSQVVPALSWSPAERLADGGVRLRSQPELTMPASAAVVADLLQSAGCVVNVVEDFTTAAWRKLMFNVAGALMALTGRRSGMFHRDGITTLTRAYLDECLGVARAEGARLGDEDIAQIIDQYREYPPDVTSSMRTDREAGRPLEWDIINGVVLRKAREHGLPAPISEIVVPLLAVASDGPG